MRLFVTIFGSVSVLLLAIGGLLFFKEQRFLAVAEEATGKVTAIEVSRDNDGESYCPVIEFATQSGQLVRFDGDICTSPPNFQVGDTENVIFDPQNPKNVQVKGFIPEYIVPFTLSAIGLVFFGVALWGFVRAKRWA